MKKLFFAALFISALAFKSADAQISISVNIGSQPDWGPTGYDHVDYYYLPDIDCFYDVPNHQYIYRNGRIWTRANTLPAHYGNYDLYNGYKVVVNEPKPYLHSSIYRTKYASYKGHRGQPVIRDSRDTKYRRPQNNNQPQQSRPQQGRPQAGHNQPNRPEQSRPQPGRPGNGHDNDHKDEHH